MTNEKWMRIAVLILALGFVVLGAAAMCNVLVSILRTPPEVATAVKRRE